MVETPSTGSKATAVTNGQGGYNFQQLAPGNYTVKVSAQGFATTTTRAKLLVSQPATINIPLSVSSADVSVDVNTNVATVNTTDATIGNAIDNATIMQLPSEGRNIQTLLALQPGVLFLGEDQSSGESRGGVVSGARSDQTNISLDGVDNNQQVYSAAFQGALRVSLDSTEEFRVTTSNANADQGRSSGGQVNMVTRSGTNSVHGAVYEYNRNTLGAANDYFNKSAQLASGEANRPERIVHNTYGARLGGPLMKNKIFLFGNYEGDRIFDANTFSRTVPSTSFRNGNLSYYNTGDTVTTLTPTQFASMDGCTTTCPWGPGVNPNVTSLFSSYPTPNGTLSGDGLNSASYSFTAVTPQVRNLYTARLDFNPSDKQRIYVRGSFQNDAYSAEPFFPGQVARYKSTDDSRGILVNYTWSPRSNITNSLRYGFTRVSYATTGTATGSYVTLRGLDLPEGSTRNSKSLIPLHNIQDDYTWTKGKHTVQFGVNYRRFTYGNTSDANSYNSATANASWMAYSGYYGTGGSFDPSVFGLPDVSPDFSTSYDYAVTQLAGLVNEETDHFNYRLSADGTTGTLLSVGQPVDLSFRSNEMEWYVQDSWKVLSNLNITAGIRHTILQTPWETAGQQVQPTLDVHQWFLNRAAGAVLGQTNQPYMSFAPSGKFHNGKPFYPMSWGNIAPRFSLAYSPTADSGLSHFLFGSSDKSSIRAGFGMYYDHFGQSLIANYMRNGGAYSLAGSATNPASVYTADTSPRYTGLHNLPGLVSGAASTITYPQQPDVSGFEITNGLDDHMKTPYSYAFNLSIQREAKGFTFEAAYVGRLGRHLLQSLDLSQPLDLVDTNSGMDYYKAGALLSSYVDEGRTNVPTIAYFENMSPEAAGGGNSATQNIYSDEWQYVRGNETQGLYDLDLYCIYGCPGTHFARYWNTQYSSLFAQSTIGSSSYHAGQFIVRHPMSHSVQFDLSYTLSKSTDIGSDTEANPSGSSNNWGFLLDAFNPRKNYAVSDFDTRHLFTADWVMLLPVGKGRAYMGNAGRLTDALIGGWNLSGIVRKSSGLPFSIYDGDGWATNWEWQSTMVQTGPVKMRKHFDANNSPQAFDDPLVARANMRDPYPGEAGQRNNFRGDGYWNVDMGLHKIIHFNDRVFMHLAGEVFNLTNSSPMDVHSIDSESTDYTQMGVYSGLLTKSRRLQLSGRIEF